MSIFKEATKQKLRFLTGKGELSTEQLWDLPRTELSRSIKAVKKILQDTDNDDDLSFLDDSRASDPVNQLRFNILKEVYIEKKAEAEKLRTAAERKANDEKILAILEEKRYGSLKEKSEEELEAMLSH